MNEPQTPSLSDLREPGETDKESYIRALYRAALKREPDPSALAKLLIREDIDRFFIEILTSAEFRRLALSPRYSISLSNKPKVLLFGAYGNGNLGDAIQALSLARSITSIRPGWEVWACSALPGSYPFEHERVLSADSILNPATVNLFDLLIIGGGGLFSHPHDPLTDPKWQEMLQVPVALIGVGAAEPVANKSELLLQKACYVSGRDSHSINTLRRYRQDVDFVPDPVLCDLSYFNRMERKELLLPAHPARRLWILKYTGSDDFKDLCACIEKNGDSVCFIEPHLDFPMVKHISNAKPVYSIASLISMIDESTEVVSMRYHGCILAMLRGKKTFGLHEPKCLSLLQHFKNKEFFSSSLRCDIDFKSMTYSAIENQLAEERIVFLQGLNRAFSIYDADSKKNSHGM